MGSAPRILTIDISISIINSTPVHPDTAPTAPDRSRSPHDVEAIADELMSLFGARQLKAMQHLRAMAISTDAVHVLLLLKELGTVTMTRLAELRGVSLPNATGIVSRMEERGLVERIHSTADRRMVTVGLTRSGEEVVAETQFAQRRLLVAVLTEMPPAERREFVSAIRQFFETAQRLLASGAFDPEPQGSASPLQSQKGTP